MDQYKRFNHKEANFRFFCGAAGADDRLIQSILKNRALLEAYIAARRDFRDALAPVPLAAPEDLPPAALERGMIPEIVARMDGASRLTGLGPMASVAGGFAQLALEAVLAAGADHAVVENGGDVCLRAGTELVLGIYPGNAFFKTRLAFRIPPGTGPLSVCSSSGTMGHSLSFGKCDLATVCAADGFLADSAATLAGNLVKEPGDIQGALDRLMEIPGVRGVLIIVKDKIGMAGELPELTAAGDPEMETRITRADLL